VIAKVLRGYRPAGLLAYLFGPGKFEEHHNPRVVASWDGAPWLHQPELLPDAENEFDLDLRQLIQTMQDWPQRIGLPLRNPPALPVDWQQLLERGGHLPPNAPSWARMYRYDAKAGAVVLRPGYVWHCPVRLHPDDPTLSDEQWQMIAERLMHAVGITQAGCRWIAVRHADDHIHLMATLVSETTGKRFHPYRDYPKLREECRQLERELGLVETAPIDKTARPAPTRQEKGKADRLTRVETTREELWRLVSQAAATTRAGEEFLAALKRAGLDPRTTRDGQGKVCGYTVALPDDLTATGARIRYSGRALAPDLSWPQLLARWTDLPPVEPARSERITPAERHAELHNAADVVTKVTEHVRHRPAAAEDVAHAAADIFATLAQGHDDGRRGPWADLALRYDRAARTPYQAMSFDAGPLARDLRHAARRLAAIGVLTGRGNEKLATMALLIALAGLVAEIAAWQQERGRHHQAAAAHATVKALPSLTRIPAARTSTAERSTLDRHEDWPQRRPDVTSHNQRIPRPRS
jgi:Relaxase/Mobilisation nuclease domain